MKLKFKKRNSPRLERIIKCVISAVQKEYGSWWRYGIPYRPYDLGITIFNHAYLADKADVLNALMPAKPRPILSFIRKDIRHRVTNPILMRVLMLILILCLLLDYLPTATLQPA